MGYAKRRANSKSKVLPHNFIEVKENFLLDIRAVVQMEGIPSDLIVNWDQTAVPSSSWTMEKRGTKRIEVSHIDDKRQITAVFACTLSGTFLPLQLITKEQQRSLIQRVSISLQIGTFVVHRIIGQMKRP